MRRARATRRSDPSYQPSPDLDSNPNPNTNTNPNTCPDPDPNPSPNLDPNPNPNPNLDPNLSPNQELDRLTEFSTFYRLPRALATKLRAYNSFRFEVNRGFDIDEITATLPPSLRSEVFLGYG